MATGELEKEDGILGNIPRHCILHALTVIEAAIFKESSSVLDDFIKELTNLVYPKGKNSALDLTQSLSQSSFLLVPSLEVNQFYENAITTQEFTIKVETRINEAMKLNLKKIDIDDIQMICWKYYSSEKKKALSFPKWLSSTCTYRLFIIFNQLLGDDMTIQITEQKMNYLLERIVLSCGFQSQAILEVIKNNHGLGIAFPEFLKKITDAFEFLKLEMSLTCEMIVDLLDEIVVGVLKKGYLVKRGGNRKNWKKRWFILKENTLFYYESRENLSQKGGMVLNKATDVIGLPDEKGKLYRFVVTCGVKGRAFEIKASDQRTKSEWMHAIKEAISLGRLKRNDLEDDDDPCEMAAHYRLKYGIGNSELTKSLPATALKHGHDSLQSSSSNSSTSTTIPTIQELDSDSDSDQTGTAVHKPSPNIPRRAKSHEHLNHSFPTVDFRQQTPPKEGTVPSPKFRHSSFIPSQQGGYDKLNFNQEVNPGGRYVNVPAGKKSASTSSLQIPNHYDYIRNSIAVTEEITEVYESSPALQRHQYQNLKHQVDTQGDDEYYVGPDNQAVQDDIVTDQIYEIPGEDAPPVPSRESKPTKHVDNDGYLKIKLNHTEAHEKERRSARSYTVADYPELTDSAK